MRKVLLAILAFSFLVSGCWDYKDLNKLSIVTGMAFDKGEGGELTVTMEIVDRAANPRFDGFRARVVEVAGEGVAETVKELSLGLDFELYYGAMAVAILGEGVPRDEIFSWLLDNREVRENLYVIYTDEIAGEKLLTEEEGGIAAYDLRNILEVAENLEPLPLYLAITEE